MKLSAKSKHAYKLLHDGALSLSQVQRNGIGIDMKYCKRKDKELQRKIESIEHKVFKSDEVKLWKKEYKKDFNFDSNTQLGDILYNHLKIEAKKHTDKGNPSVDQEALEMLDFHLVKDILQLRKYKKMKNTFLAGIIRESNYYKDQDAWLLQPFFNLHTVSTWRSSSQNVNFQNQPIRDEEMGPGIRTAFIPRKDRHLVEVDYGGIEVCISACYHKDPTMIQYIKDPTKDMHRDMAMQCYILDQNQWTKNTRYCAKNKFVFPQFYGDSWYACSQNLWDSIATMKLKTKDNVPLKKHLKSKGIKKFSDFQKHIKDVEHDFWYNRFAVYQQWKEDHFDNYIENGYFDLHTGFRCFEPLDRNKVINYPVQGAAFHCLLKSLIIIQKWLINYKMKTKIVGQIHDSIIFDAHPKELDAVLVKCKEVMCERIPRIWKWINVPLTIEAEITPINGSWNKKKEIPIPVIKRRAA